MFRYLFISLIIFSIFLFSCNQETKVNEEPAEAYFDYMVWGDEENGFVTVKLQYRAGGSNGENFRIQAPGRVTVDGTVITGDTAGLNGAYYEVIKPVAEFAGKHSIILTDPDGKQYRTDFDFPVITLKNEIPAVVSRDSIVLEINGLSTQDTIRVLLNDTSFRGNGIQRLGKLRNGKLVIRQFRDLKPGPIFLELLREQHTPLRLTKAGGRLSVSYGLRREFILADTSGLVTN